MKIMINFFWALALLVASQQSFATTCMGTEPFWIAQVSEQTIDVNLWGSPESAVSLSITSSGKAYGLPESVLKSYFNDHRPVATLTSAQCSDGMSDRIYPQTAIIYLNDTHILYGCCGQGEPIVENPVGLVALEHGDQYTAKIYTSATQLTPIGECAMDRFFNFNKGDTQAVGKEAIVQCLASHPFQTHSTGDANYPYELISYEYANGRHRVGLNNKLDKKAPLEHLWLEVSPSDALKFTSYRERVISQASTFSASWDKSLYRIPGLRNNSVELPFVYDLYVPHISFSMQGFTEVGGKVWLQLGTMIDNHQECGGLGGPTNYHSHLLPYQGLWVPLTDHLGQYNIRLVPLLGGC